MFTIGKWGYPPGQHCKCIYTCHFLDFSLRKIKKISGDNSPETPAQSKGGVITISKRTRNFAICFYLTESENALLLKKMKQAGINNRSAYIRKMILDGYIIHQDYSALRECIAALGRIGNNLNQLTKLANTYHDMNVPELARLADEVSQWRQRFLKDLK